jgi:hypothetical protein
MGGIPGGRPSFLGEILTSISFNLIFINKLFLKIWPGQKFYNILNQILILKKFVEKGLI